MCQRVGIIGGGASGMTAAIAAARAGSEVVIYERNDRLGRKILSTGNGKCNLGNTDLSMRHYHSDDTDLVRRCLERFDSEATIAFFEELGLMIRKRDDYLYPYNEQASSVLDVLRYNVVSLGIRVEYGAYVTSVRKKSGVGFEVCYGDRRSVCDRIIIACGSKAAPVTGSDGSGYRLAKELGISVTDPVPALVQLRCREEYCKSIAGVRARACVRIYCEGQNVAEDAGEVQFTEYGISGIPVLQLSRDVNLLIKEKKEPEARIDFVPDISDEEWKDFTKRRIESMRCRDDLTVEEFFTGILHKKLMMLFIRMSGLKSNTPLKEVPDKKLNEVFLLCRCFTLHISGSNSFRDAQTCAGGVDLHEVTSDLESIKVPGLYFAGEVLNVDGMCGGYNLQWAWCSGTIAGESAGGTSC